MARIAITGAAGSVGRQALAALSDHDTLALTHNPAEDLDNEVVDVTDRDAFERALAGVDVLVHLAANPRPEATWDDLSDLNVGGLYNAYEAAVANDLERVVFPSSNHAVGMYNAADPADPESLKAAGIQSITVDDPTNPDSLYGVTKVAGEAMGDVYAARHDLAVVNLRIGWLLSAEELRDLQDEEAGRARFARAIWLSPRDCRHALRRAVAADLEDSPVTVHVTSRNDERYMSLVEAATELDFRPRDNAGETLS